MIRTYFIAPGFSAEIDTDIKGISIAGEDRTFDIKLEGTSIEQVLTSQEDNCRFTIKSGDKPTVGQEIIISDSVTRFAGIIDMVQDDPISPDTTFYKCQARDYTYQLDKKLVIEVYENQNPDVIALDILSKYCTGFTGTNVHTGGPSVEYIAFDYKRPSECFKELADYIGWDWYVDYDKDVHFFNPETLAEYAPVTVDTTTNVRNFKHDLEEEGLRNRVYVRGGTMLSDYVTYEYVADGAQRAWILPYKPHDITLTVSGGAQITPGIENIDDETAKTWIMNYQEKMVRLAVGQSDVVTGSTVAFTFKYDMPVDTMREDPDSQAAVAAIQGGDGIYEHIIVDDSLTTLEAAEAAAEADLKEHANSRVKGSFETEIDGWAPGQLVVMALPDRGAEGTFLTQRVTLTPLDANQWTFKVEYGGRLLGIADFLRSIVSAQQKKKLSETATISKGYYVSETTQVADALTVTTLSPRMYCGDPNAICGFVECATWTGLRPSNTLAPSDTLTPE